MLPLFAANFWAREMYLSLASRVSANVVFLVSVVSSCYQLIAAFLRTSHFYHFKCDQFSPFLSSRRIFKKSKNASTSPLYSGERLTLETSANKLFTAFNISTSTSRWYILRFTATPTQTKTSSHRDEYSIVFKKSLNCRILLPKSFAGIFYLVNGLNILFVMHVS